MLHSSPNAVDSEEPIQQRTWTILRVPLQLCLCCVTYLASALDVGLAGTVPTGIFLFHFS